jgi:DNA segregation ATPase FtsK/SpoIIIE-like protein
VRSQGEASASLLQRRMHIGYPRASRLIDEMYDLGIVGPAETGGRARRVLPIGVQSLEEPADDNRANGGARAKHRAEERSGGP